ncbi:hypothetical protein DV736_g5650, partial [Chaetothyriales sp. CBS 134916]
MPLFPSPVDGSQLHYVDYTPATSPPPWHPKGPGSGAQDDCRNEGPPPIRNTTALVFVHGWPMSHQMYEHLLLPLCEDYRFRCIASDRRGFGKSEWSGKDAVDITYDTFAADTVALLKHLNLENFIMIAASMGCGETLLAYNSMPAALQARCKGLVWLGASLPFPLKTESNPDAPSRELWDMIIQSFRDDRVSFVKASIAGVFGIPLGIEVAPTILDKYADIVHQADALAIERCIQIILSKDFSEDLKKIDGRVKVLMIHGDSDQSMPVQASVALVPKFAKQTEVKLYEKAAHGLYQTHVQQLIDDILGFVKSL